MRGFTPLRRSHQESGFTMLEVLIAILVIAIGTLGMAGLQVVTLKNTQSSHYRSIAVQLANDIAERMRGNMNGVLANSYNRTSVSVDYSTAVANCTNTTGCTYSDLAINDAYEWQQLIAAQLPGGQGLVCIDSTPNDGTSASVHGCDGVVPSDPNQRPLHAIKIFWLDDRSQANTTGAKAVYIYSFRL